MDKKFNPEQNSSAQFENVNENSQALSVEEINKAKATSQIYFDGNSTFYSLNEHEFKSIVRGNNNSWKELTIATLFLFLPLLLNTISEGNRLNWQTSSWDLFFNGLFSFASLVLTIAFGIAWKKSKNEVEEIIKRVEKKPKFKI